MVTVVELVARDVGLTFRIPKCAVLHMIRGTLQNQAAVITGTGHELHQLERGEYLGFLEAAGVPHEDIKSSLMSEYCTRLKQVLQSNP